MVIIRTLAVVRTHLHVTSHKQTTRNSVINLSHFDVYRASLCKNRTWFPTHMHAIKMPSFIIILAGPCTILQ